MSDVRQRVLGPEATRTWYRGVHGERWVSLELARLGSAWTVLASVPVGRRTAPCDFVAIGPGGVFAITAKYSPGSPVRSSGVELTVGGRDRPADIARAMAEARQVGRRLSAATGADVPVTGLLVFVDSGAIRRLSPAGDGIVDLRVISDTELVEVLGGPTVLEPGRLAVLASAAARPDTWYQRPVAARPAPLIERIIAAVSGSVAVVTAGSLLLSLATR